MKGAFCAKIHLLEGAECNKMKHCPRVYFTQIRPRANQEICRPIFSPLPFAGAEIVAFSRCCVIGCP